MEQIKLSDIPIHELGTQIVISGMVMQGNGETYAVMFPTAELQQPKIIHVSLDEWKKLLHQVDTLEVKLFPGNPESKVTVRKSQRNIESMISWNVFRRDKFYCRYCGNDKGALSVDHIILWEDMGASVEDNLLTACPKCNRTRGNMKFEDWIISDYYKKVISNFGAGFNNHHQYNLDMFEKAKLVPLRINKRNR